MRCPTIISLVGAALILAGPLKAEALHPRDLSFPDLRFEPLVPKRFTTSQGITLVVMEDHELPTVNFSAMLRAGDYLDPPEKIGLAEMTARVMRTGGAGKWKGDALDEALDFAAASLALGTRVQFASIGGRCLTQDFDFLLEVLEAVLRRPQFAPEKIEVARQAMLEGLRRQNDEPSPIARRELKKIIYGPDSPWARTPTPETLKAITRQDLIAFHQRYYRPSHLILGVAGDVQAEQLREKLEALFEGWQPGAIPDLPGPTKQAARPGIYLVRKDLNQTTVRMGHLGLPLLHPDFHACMVMNRILGIGTFTSRMGREIRSNRGLAYSVGSGLFEGNGPGMFIAVAQTKAPSTHEVVQVMQEIIVGMGSGDITEKELQDAKNTLLNQWVFEFEQGEKIVAKKVEHEFLSYPANFLAEYPGKIAAVTREDVVRCAQEHLRPKDLAILLVGSPEQIGKPLEELGEVTEIDLPTVP
jgi:predicted Zn-dependent peptidase